MSVIKKVSLFLVSFVFRLSLFFGLILLAAVLVLSNPDTPKETLKEVDAYDRFTQSIIDSAKNSKDTNPNSIPFDRPEIQEVLKNSLDEKTLSSIANSFVDSTHAWLSGNTTEIEFSADVSGNKKVFADGVANFAVQRISNLEPCTSVPKNTNVFDVECNPTGVDLSNLSEDIKRVILEDKTVLPSTRITIDNFPKNSEGLVFTDAYPDAPKYFGYFKLTPYILLGVAFLMAVIIVFTARTKRQGLKTVGFSFITTAIIMAVTPLIYLYVLPAVGIKPPDFSGQDQTISAIVNDSMSQLYSSFNVMIINIAIQVAIVGVIFVMSAKFLKSNSSLYLNLEKKSGLSVSEAPNSALKKTELPEIPIQTSEVKPLRRKKTSALEKKYRKM